MNKKKTSITLSEEGYSLLDELSTKLGLPLNGVIEISIRFLAEREGIKEIKNSSDKSKETT